MATTKQKKAIKRVVENGGNVSRAMVEAGYSEATAHTPSKLTESKAFSQFLEDEGITDEKLAKRLNEGLDATIPVVTEKVIGVGKNRIKTEEVKLVASAGVRHKYIETVLKLKGYLRETPPAQLNIIALILKKWGLDDVEQNTGDASRLPQNRI